METLTKRKTKTICFYSADRVKELFTLIDEAKRKHFIDNNILLTYDDIAIDIFIPALKNYLNK